MPEPGRTHEPSLRELSAEFDGFIELMKERDRRYEDRFKAQDEKTTLALTASKEAIGKAESATEKRFDAVNEFRGTLSDQAARLLPRAEADSRFANYDEKIANQQKDIQNLRESRSEGGGRQLSREYITGIGLTIAGLIIAAAVLLGRFMR
jgi:hypothetical protein